MINQQFNRRRELLPWWMKVFIWICMFLGASSIASRLFGILGISLWLNSNGEKSIYGMETFENYSLLALLISTLLIFKGITAFGMWMEKDWAIKFGMIDAGVGIVICVIMMFIEPLIENNGGKFNLNFRFELLLLIPYLIKCFKIRKPWNEIAESNSLKTPSVTNKYKIETTNIKKIEPEKSTEESIAFEEKINVEEKIDREDPTRFMPK